MLTAVHSDRSGRFVISHDHGAAAFDGTRDVPLEGGVPLPEDAELVPIEREALGIDRAGRPRGLGRTRWALGAVMPAGMVRTLHPSYIEATTDAVLPPRALAAIGADPDGRLHAAGHRTSSAAPRPLTATLPVAPRGDPVSRQLARCAHENRCAGAIDALRHGGAAALPVGADRNERPPRAIAMHARADAAPRELAAMKPDATELAAFALAHFAAGGERVSFGRACEGEPLRSPRLLEDAMTRIRAARPDAIAHIETNGSLPTALRRLASMGLREVTIRLASARADTYDALHGPEGYRLPDVRASIHVAHELGLRLTLALLLAPGISDLPDEADALVALARETPGATLELRDLAVDARRAMALVPRGLTAPAGIGALVARLEDR